MRLPIAFMSCLSAFVPALAQDAQQPALKLHLRSQAVVAAKNAVLLQDETWPAKQSAIIVCDVWDAHHCLNAVRRVEEMAPRMNRFLAEARHRGALIIHAPSGCMATYKDHPGRKLAQAAPKAANLPADIGQWCYKIPAEDTGVY